MKFRHACLLGCILSALCLCGRSAKILIISSPVYSHCVEVGAVGQELSTRGHNVSIFLPHDFNAIFQQCYAQGDGKIAPILYSTTASKARKSMSEVFQTVSDWVNRGQTPSVLDQLMWYPSVFDTFCSNMMADVAALERLRDESFDMAIIGGVFLSYCYYVIPFKLGIPYATVSSLNEDILIGRPFLPSISPHFMSDYSGDMTIFERASNMFVHLAFNVVSKVWFPFDAVSSYAPELGPSDVLNLVTNSELFLHNTDPVLSYPLPTMPNHILVGGLATRRAENLTGEFKKVYQDAKNGVILVTFGSAFGKLSTQVHSNLLGALRKLDVRIIWKYHNDIEFGNVKEVKWFPQNDLLGHPKTRLFVSHCGNNGLFEALYHAVPFVCMPLFADQFYNAARVVNWNVGSKINIYDTTEDDIFQTINAALSNSDFRENINRASQMYHSRPGSPRENAAFWLEHVLKYGGSHLRPKAADMSVLTCLGLDVICLFVTVLLSMFLTSYFLIRCCIARCIKGIPAEVHVKTN